MNIDQNFLIRIAIIEDNRFIRNGFEMLLDSEKDFEMIGSYPSCEDAFCSGDISKANIVLMDVRLPGMSGIDGVKYLKKHFPKAAVLICTAYEDDENVFNAIIAGAVGFIAKKTPPTELLNTARDVAKGGSPMTPNVAVKVVLFFQKQELKKDSIALTESEQKVLEKISLGKSYTTDAKELFETEEKILFQIRSIYGKLQKRLVAVK